MNEYFEFPEPTGEGWVETYSGGKLHLLKPQLDEINIKDIAHSLSLLCRFTGHCSRFISVAEHSVYVMELVDSKQKLAALLHDASEAYTSDINRPMKAIFPDFKHIEVGIQDAIYCKFGVKSYDKEAIKKADNIMLATEATQVMNNTYGWDLTETPLKKRLEFWSPEQAENIFLVCFQAVKDL